MIHRAPRAIGAIDARTMKQHGVENQKGAGRRPNLPLELSRERDARKFRHVMGARQDERGAVVKCEIVDAE